MKSFVEQILNFNSINPDEFGTNCAVSIDKYTKISAEIPIFIQKVIYWWTDISVGL